MLCDVQVSGSAVTLERRYFGECLTHLRNGQHQTSHVNCMHRLHAPCMHLFGPGLQSVKCMHLLLRPGFSTNVLPITHDFGGWVWVKKFTFQRNFLPTAKMTSQQVLTITHISKRGTTQVMSYLLVERVIYDGSQDAAEHQELAWLANKSITNETR